MERDSRTVSKLFVAIAIIISMLLSGAVVTGSAWGEDVPGYISITKDHVERSTVILTATVQGQNGEEKKQFQSDGNKEINVTDVVPDRDMDFYVEINLKDDQVVNADGTKNLNWVYNLPIPASMIKDSEFKNHPVYEGSQKVADIEVCKRDDGTAYLKVTYDENYASNKDNSYYFSYDLSTVYKAEEVTEPSQNAWEFPGTGTSITVTHVPWKITGNKNCGYKGKSNTDLTCKVTLNVEGDVKDFKFEDALGSELKLTSDMVVTSSSSDQARADAAALTDQLKDKKTSASLELIHKGYYEITYDTQITTNPLPDDGSIENAKNTAKWHWEEKNDEASYTPSVRKFNYNWLNKWGNSKTDADGNFTGIEWSVEINSASDRANLAGYEIKDTLQNGQKFTGEATVEVCDENNSCQTYRSTDSNLPNGIQALMPQKDGTEFSYTFPANTDDFNRYKITYITTVPNAENDPDGTKYQNKAEICKEEDCPVTMTPEVSKPSKPSGGGENPPTEPEKPVDGKLLEKSVGDPSLLNNKGT